MAKNSYKKQIVQSNKTFRNYIFVEILVFCASSILVFLKSGFNPSKTRIVSVFILIIAETVLIYQIRASIASGYSPVYFQDVLFISWAVHLFSGLSQWAWLIFIIVFYY